MQNFALLFFASLAIQVGLAEAIDTRSLLQRREAAAECKTQGLMNWPGFDMLLEPIATSDPRKCCARCQERNGCRVWLLRIKTGECYLKEDVGFPIPCFDCVGGILDDDPFAGFNACRGIGRACADRAAQAACQEVRNACNIPVSKDETVIEYPRSLSDVGGKVVSFHLSARGVEVDLETKDARVICEFLIRETCKETAKQASESIDDECHRLVFVHGPEFSSDGRATKNQAQRIFHALVEAICDSSV